MWKTALKSEVGVTLRDSRNQAAGEAYQSLTLPAQAVALGLLMGVTRAVCPAGRVVGVPHCHPS